MTILTCIALSIGIALAVLALVVICACVVAARSDARLVGRR
jgi:hypothetical protein